MNNIIVHTPTQLFVEYSKADLKRETTIHVISEIKECIINSLDNEFRFISVFAFISDSCNVMGDVHRSLQDKTLLNICMHAALIASITWHLTCPNGVPSPQPSKRPCKLAKLIKKLAWYANYFICSVRNDFGKSSQWSFINVFSGYQLIICLKDSWMWGLS